MKTKTDLFNLFNQLGIAYKTYEHEPLFTVEQADKVAHAIPGTHIKNLFLKDHNGKLWLIVAEAHAKIELKKIMQLLKAPKLRFADAQLLMKHLGVTPGSVTPFGLINDGDQKVNVVLDHTILQREIINAHPLENCATTAISVADLKKFLKALGHQIFTLDLTAIQASN
jgi:Ala-tRNA(Pro) deacylase